MDQKEREEMRKKWVENAVYKYEFERYKTTFEELKRIEDILAGSKDYDEAVYQKYLEKYEGLLKEKEELRVILTEKQRKKEQEEQEGKDER